MVDCKTVSTDLPGYVRGQLSLAAAAAIRAHVHSCLGCREQADRFAKLEALLTSHLPTIRPSAAFASTFASRLAAEMANEEESARQREGWLGWLVRPWLIPIAVTAAMAGILFAPWAGGPKPDDERVASAPSAPVHVAKSPAADRAVAVSSAQPLAGRQLTSSAPPEEVRQRPGLFVDFAVIEELDELLSAENDVSVGKAG